MAELASGEGTGFVDARIYRTLEICGRDQLITHVRGFCGFQTETEQMGDSNVPGHCFNNTGVT